jgi:ankyrin repeat protein
MRKAIVQSLHCARYDGHVAVANELRSRGANIEAKTAEGDTPLHVASFSGHLSII